VEDVDCYRGEREVKLWLLHACSHHQPSRNPCHLDFPFFTLLQIALHDLPVMTADTTCSASLLYPFAQVSTYKAYSIPPSTHLIHPSPQYPHHYLFSPLLYSAWAPPSEPSLLHQPLPRPRHLALFPPITTSNSSHRLTTLPYVFSLHLSL